MGVSGLWDVLRPAGTSRSFTAIAVDGFADTGSTRNFRAFRVGIDASIWFVHSTYGKEGENPELRTIFFRLIRLLKHPFLPLFVFDGPMRPDVKRGKLIDKKPHWMVDGMKKMVEAFGFEWRTAPGEAEAELAYLNRIGVIDAVLPSDTLSGNRSHARATKNHTMTFSSHTIETHPEVGLTHQDLVLVALLSGGDYHHGLDACGISVAIGLARAGFGRSLVAKVQSLALSVQHVEGRKTKVSLSGAEKCELDTFLEGWRVEVAEELRTNSRKLLGKRSPKAAANLLALGNAFPNVDVLMAYINPVTSEERAVAKATRANPSTTGTELANIVLRAKEDVARSLGESIIWARDPSVRAIAKVCEDYFEWGYRDRIIQRFTSWLWEGIVCRTLRRKTILRDLDTLSSTPATATALRLDQLDLSSTKNSSTEQVETTLRPLILKITSTRAHATTDHLPEYRLEIDPYALIRAAEAGIEGRRSAPTTDWSDDEDMPSSDDEGRKGQKFDESATRRYWLPACMVVAGEPGLARGFEEVKAAKELRKATRGNGRGRAKAASTMRCGSVVTPLASYDGDEHTDSVTSAPDVTPRSGRAVPPAAAVQPSAEKRVVASMSDYFKASKTMIPPSLRVDKEPAQTLPSGPRKDVVAGVTKGKIRASTTSNTSRVALLFDAGDELRVIKDLTKPKSSVTESSSESTTPAQLKATLFENTEYSVFKDLTMPKGHRAATTASNPLPEKARQRTFSSAPSQAVPDGLEPTLRSRFLQDPWMASSIPSMTNLGPTTESQLEAGPSKPSSRRHAMTRISTWKPTPFPITELSIASSDEDTTHTSLTYQRRTRRASTSRPFDTAKRSDELQKSPRKSKKQASPHSSKGVSPSHGEAVPSMEKPTACPQRRAVTKTTHVIEISSDSDVPVPPKDKPRNLQNAFKARNAREPTAIQNHRPLQPTCPLLPQEIEVIDLCSD
ncbi:uncharacterized protein PHACADRAFT_149458 [Phanerochaete carnosa HHB-10118-sp]|uniref:XPG-I domain-containing protein n=1 Tax=Phanerochaete carnosa (strain HHB-10118-sp) TaxID=650164 RepID=K5W0J8_PHACS|nr:uncharacterized protein PHACADRAFT_149458 [Phanerochaete carnosa HHB-10118-sp]EKM52630.1 hypothetical protein PHACADRAFT_149458 [Phanerochaete carnosa HHB-10118-sp]